jgi:hypothetical protein
VTVVDNERCDGGWLLSETSMAMSSIWYLFHTAILPFLLQRTLKSTLSPSDASRFCFTSAKSLVEQDFEKSSDARTRGEPFHVLASSEGGSQVIHHTNHGTAQRQMPKSQPLKPELGGFGAIVLV